MLASASRSGYAHARQTEVEQHGAAAFAHQHIGGFQIEVAYFVFDAGCAPRRDSAPMRAISPHRGAGVVEPVLQRRAADVFHDQIRQREISPAATSAARAGHGARQDLLLDLEPDEVLGAVRGCHARHFHDESENRMRLRGIRAMHAVDACHAARMDAFVDHESVDRCPGSSSPAIRPSPITVTAERARIRAK